MWSTRVDPGRATDRLARPFLYAGGDLGGSELAVVGGAAAGLVVRGKPGAAQLTQLRRELGWSHPAVIDPACYERPTFHPASHAESLFGVTGYWRGLQSDHRVAAYLSPSFYVPDGDQRGLDEVLAAGRRFRAGVLAMPHQAPAFVVVPIDRRWLTGRPDRLADALLAAGVPVALVLADRNDPLGSRAAVEGLLHVLGRVPEVALLRTDLAALGAIANGAVFAAVGSGTSVRHLVPPGQSGGGVRHDRSPSVLVEPLLCYRKGSWLAQLDADDGMLDCACWVCAGRTVRRFDDPTLAAEARLHSAAIWVGLADWLLASEPGRRQAAWSGRCAAALAEHDELAGRTGIPISPPAYLSAWAGSGTAA